MIILIICLTLLHLYSIFFLSNINPEISLTNSIYFSALYISLIFGILFNQFFFFRGINSYIGFNARKTRENVSKYFLSLSLLIIFLFLTLPSVNLIMHFWQEPAEAIRYLVNYGTDDFVNDIYFFGSFGMLISKYYVISFFWFFLIYILFSGKFKYRSLILFFMVLNVFLLSISTFSRTPIYFLLIIISIYFLTASDKRRFSIKVISLPLLALIFSGIMQSFRNDSDYAFNESILSIIDYHIIAPHILNAFIISNDLAENFTFLPGYNTFTSAFAPFYFILGIPYTEVPILQLWSYVNYPLILDADTGEASNAFVTLFASFYLDYGYFAPFAVFTYIILIGFFIRTFNIKTRAILYIWFNFSLYISLFQADILSIFSSTLILIIIFIGIKNIIFLTLRKIVIQ